MVLKIHLGEETRQTAKTSCARRYLDLHYKHVERRRAALSSQWYPTPVGSDGHIDVSKITHSFKSSISTYEDVTVSNLPLLTV